MTSPCAMKDMIKKEILFLNLVIDMFYHCPNFIRKLLV